MEVVRPDSHPVISDGFHLFTGESNPLNVVGNYQFNSPTGPEGVVTLVTGSGHSSFGGSVLP